MGETGRVRMVATDLDGTIVRADGTISARSVAAFHACSRAGIDVVFVTGRPPRWMGPVADATGHTGTAICGNGALVYDLGAEKILRARTLAPDDVRDVVKRVRDAIGDVQVAIESLEGFLREPGYRTRWDAQSDQRVGNLDEMLELAPSVVKLLVRQEGSTGDAMLAAVRPVLEGIAQPTHSNVNDCLVEVSALGVSKASTLAALAAQRGIDRADVVAFGDMPNDLEMLGWAGRGYAIADGHPEAVAAADAVAPPCHEDGVAQVLEDLLRS
jgi:Cof subfamily protein (haloacid dehalogenase superfamily)